MTALGGPRILTTAKGPRMTSALRWLVTAAMAVAMVIMLAESLTRPAAQWWALGFGVATAWFGWAALRT